MGIQKTKENISSLELETDHMKPFLFLRIALYSFTVQQFRQAVINSGNTSFFGIIPTESFKVKQSSRFEKFIREKKWNELPAKAIGDLWIPLGYEWDIPLF